jgi:hypothetical protein
MHTVTTEQRHGKNMRTKTLIIAFAALTIGVATLMAQTYSRNIVGYINLNLTNGYNLIANQLDADGTGTNNTVGGIFGTNLPPNSQILAWQPGSANYSAITWAKGKSGYGWAGNTNTINQNLGPGGGVFAYVTNNVTITFVGNVLQGTNINPYMTNAVLAYYLVSAMEPIQGSIQTNLNFFVSANDKLLKWTPASQTFGSTYTYSKGKSGYSWSPNTPSLNVGEACYIVTSNQWTNIFNP